ITQSAFADFTERGGGAEAGTGMPPGSAVISGYDRRRDTPYVNQTFFGSQGGGANCDTDGWLTFLLPVTAGVLYRDSVEVAEDKYPIVIKEMRVLTDTGGPGYRRGAPGSRVVYGPTHDPMRVVYLGDGHETPPRGVKGGKDGVGTSAAKVSETGEELELPNQGEATIEPDAWIVGVQSSGGGYGNPIEREPERVLTDVYERFVSVEAAREEYGVVIVETGDPGRRLEIDLAATEELRRTRSGAFESERVRGRSRSGRAR
ncbi:MAG: hydantoinase B/oxoprolinase family protein, partial [Actinobacteria bacterium]|nr:hydantoinase B/oxoprolinase family protein [Actinomycetota bacterium]